MKKVHLVLVFTIQVSWWSISSLWHHKGDDTEQKLAQLGCVNVSRMERNVLVMKWSESPENRWSLSPDKHSSFPPTLILLSPSSAFWREPSFLSGWIRATDLPTASHWNHLFIKSLAWGCDLHHALPSLTFRLLPLVRCRGSEGEKPNVVTLSPTLTVCVVFCCCRLLLQKSEHEFLDCVGDDLSDIIGQKDKRNIKNQLPQIVEHYPDFRSELPVHFKKRIIVKKEKSGYLWLRLDQSRSD